MYVTVLANVVFVTGKETYNTNCVMKKLYIVTIIWGLLFPILMDAQTIYHYQKVATVDPTNGIKKEFYGQDYLHIIFDGNNTLWVVNEKGEKQKNNIPKDTYDWSYSSIGARGKYIYESRGNGLNVFHCKFGMRRTHKTTNWYYLGSIRQGWNAGDYVDDIYNDDYIYVSDDKHKINTRFKKSTWVSEIQTGMGGLPYQGGHSEDRYGDIDVYELYDTDEKGSIPSSTSSL